MEIVQVLQHEETLRYYIPYFFGYKANIFPFKTILKIYIHLLRQARRVKLIAKFHRTDLVICSHSGERKILSYSRINMVLVYVQLHINAKC